MTLAIGQRTATAFFPALVFRKMTYRGWPIPAYDKPESARPRYVILRLQQIAGVDLPGPGRFRLVVSRNLWDQMEGAWLWTQMRQIVPSVQCTLCLICFECLVFDEMQFPAGSLFV